MCLCIKYVTHGVLEMKCPEESLCTYKVQMHINCNIIWMKEKWQQHFEKK